MLLHITINPIPTLIMNFPIIHRYVQYSFTGIAVLVATAIAINFLVIQGWSSASPGHEGGHGDEQAIQGSDSAYPIVTVVQPSDASSHNQTIEAAGQVLSQKQGNVYARRDGVVSTLHVNLGDTVYKGQPLAYLQPDQDQSEIAAEIAFKKRQLELSRKRASNKTDSHLLMVEKSIETVKQGQEASLNQIDVQIEGLKKEVAQKESQVETAGFDLLDSIAEVLFTRSDGISNYYRHSSYDYYRRTQIYYGQGQETEVKAFEQDVLQLYKDLKSGIAEDDADTLVERLIDLGNKGRLYAQSYNDSPNFQYAEIDQVRKEIAETVDHITDVSLEFTEKESDLASLEAEKDQILAETTRNVVDSEREKVDIEGDRKDADIDAEEIEAEIAKLQQQLGASSTVYAPFAGVITKRHVNVGDSLNDEKPLFSLVDDSHKFVRFYVSENDLPFIAEGSAVLFSPTSAPSTKYEAIIKRISKAIDPVNRTILVEADIPNQSDNARILTEMTVRVSIPVSFDENLVAVPESTFEVSGDQTSVWIVNASAEAEKRTVTVAYLYGGFAYVSEGITANDWIVTKSPTELTAGMPVDTTL